jgi:hypothetical protein
MGSAGHLVHSVSSEAQNVDTLVFMLGWARCEFHKKHAGTRYNKHVFLHPVGSVGHVDCFVASGMQNIIALFLCSGGPSVDPNKST